MENPSSREFPDLEEGFYFFPGGYLVIQGENIKVLQHDNKTNNFEHLHRVHKCRGKLPDQYLGKIQTKSRRLPRKPLDEALRRDDIRRLLDRE